MLLKRFINDMYSPGVGAMKIPISGLIAKYRQAHKDMLKFGTIEHVAYRLMPNDMPIVHFKMPSRSVKGMKYDVVIGLIQSNPAVTSFENCHVKFFCNAKSFTYSGTAYLFHHMTDPDLGDGGYEEDVNGESVPVNRLTFLESLLDDNAFSQPPTIKNPYQIPILFDNVTGAALIELLSKCSFGSIMYNKKTITYAQLAKNINSSGKADIIRRKLQLEEKRQKEIAKSKTDKNIKTALKTTSTENKFSTGTNRISATPSAKSISSIKHRNSSVKKIKSK